MLTETRSLPRSGSISSTTPALVLERTIGHLYGLADAEADLGFYRVLTFADLREQASTSGGRIGIGRSLVPAKPITPGVSLMKYQVRSTSWFFIVKQEHVDDQVTREKFPSRLGVLAALDLRNTLE